MTGPEHCDKMLDGLCRSIDEGNITAYHDPFVVLASSPVVLLSPFPELDDVAAALADGVTVDGATTITVVIPEVIVEGVIGALLAGTVLVTIPAVVVPCAAAAAQKP